MLQHFEFVFIKLIWEFMCMHLLKYILPIDWFDFDNIVHK